MNWWNLDLNDIGKSRGSNLIDIILKPLCGKVLSYIRDDLDFLNRIPDEVEESTILVTSDVVSLYTSIPHDLGLDAIKFWLENYGESLARPFLTEFIMEAVSIILKENTFQFNDQHYKQLQGTAMGTKMAPTYATLVMGYLEKLLYQSYEEKYGAADAELFIKLFKRFLDDCCLLWNKSKDQLTDLYQLLNSLYPKIKLTDKLPFLDILLHKDQNKLYTDIYYKVTPVFRLSILSPWTYQKQHSALLSKKNLHYSYKKRFERTMLKRTEEFFTETYLSEPNHWKGNRKSSKTKHWRIKVTQERKSRKRSLNSCYYKQS